MTNKIEEKILKILSQVSEQEKKRNKILTFRTERVLIALGYMKLTAKKLKIAN